MRHNDNMDRMLEASVDSAADALLEALRDQPVPPVIMELAVRLQTKLDARRQADTPERAAPPVGRT